MRSIGKKRQNTSVQVQNKYRSSADVRRRQRLANHRRYVLAACRPDESLEQRAETVAHAVLHIEDDPVSSSRPATPVGIRNIGSINRSPCRCPDRNSRKSTLQL